MLSLLLNAQKPPFDANFTAMSPVYNISFGEMKHFFIEKAKDFVKKIVPLHPKNEEAENRVE